jgi:folylpolyglutamate synthase/dihydropteroate synthase
VAAAAEPGTELSVEPALERALERARERAGGGTVLATGSVHTVGEVRRILAG